jgi:hypothetical protein
MAIGDRSRARAKYTRDTRKVTAARMEEQRLALEERMRERKRLDEEAAVRMEVRGCYLCKTTHITHSLTHTHTHTL